MNLNGTCADEDQRAGLPRFIHATLDAPQDAPRAVVNGRSRGTLRLAPAIEYPELGAIPEHAGKPFSQGLPTVIPIPSVLELTYALDVTKRTFRIGGVTLLPEFPPLSPSLTPLFFNIKCTIAPECTCKRMCLDIKVAPTDNDSPILSAQRIERIVRKLNNIWAAGLRDSAAYSSKARGWDAIETQTQEDRAIEEWRILG